ncbi:photosynthetic reaction center subunit H [Iodidimonas nitroreducens]|uniref:Photosynthetic reaction center subunit H n=1 Tax=Iodidimonas nitroreducens TaxID=1236968 RepID=A0A5A7N7D0_9PROT|nr:photosynthetic reaction center subunit H [Iodidimonas nitroreducens]GAK32658.1 reaction center protein H chain [alpha proteobacterium Q-1]GER04211.1 photosynthetic reaction center subunit H [Iodidimonas nitroreducens]
MEPGAITSSLDVAQMVLYAFWLFFAGLIFYLRREDRREGYPLERDNGALEDHGLIWVPEKPKSFKLAHGPVRETFSGLRDSRSHKLEKRYAFEGSPYDPTGDPMADGVGPAAYAERHDHPDLTIDGAPKILPLRLATSFYPAAEDNDPRGMTVYGADGKEAGVISDLWVDCSEYLARYLEIETTDGGGSLLLPINFARIRGPKGYFARLSGINPVQPGVYVRALRADQFQAVPRTASRDQVTLLEEDKICGFYGGGLLYATPDRMEPLI